MGVLGRLSNDLSGASGGSRLAAQITARTTRSKAGSTLHGWHGPHHGKTLPNAASRWDAGGRLPAV